jgi:hypothetical protein
MLRLKITFIILFLLGYARAYAGGYPPSDIELKAAYCVDPVTEAAKAWDIPISDSDPRFTSENLNFLRTERDKALSNLNRVRSYLMPKSKYLDTDALLLAINRSKADRASFEQCIEKKNCKGDFVANEKILKCYEDCNKDTGGTRDRLRMCHNIDWLPF